MNTHSIALSTYRRVSVALPAMVTMRAPKRIAPPPRWSSQQGNPRIAVLPEMLRGVGPVYEHVGA